MADPFLAEIRMVSFGFAPQDMQPYLTFYFNIALQGVFPPRT
jgi:microcystin-dependent protein